MELTKQKNKKIIQKSGIGDFIRSKRKERNLTQRQLAEFAGVSFTFLNRVENGSLDIMVSTLNKVLAVFNYETGPTLLAYREEKEHD